MLALDTLIETFALPNALPGAAQYTFSTANTNAKLSVRGAKFINTDTVARTITLHHVPAGGAAAAANKHFAAVSIPAGKTWEISYDEGEWTLRSGDSLWMFADAASAVNAYFSGQLHE